MAIIEAAAPKRSWLESLQAFLHPRVITMLFLGFSAGLPILLIFGTLSLWLREADVSRSAVTMFSWAALGYSFKFVWAPIVDKMPLPGLTRRLGRRRAWLLMSQIAVIGAMLFMGSTDPKFGLVTMAFAAVAVGFASATQDIVIDAYRIESAPDEDLLALMSATYIAGYRIGMLVAGAGALKIAFYLGTSKDDYIHEVWLLTYVCIAACMLVGIVTTLLIPEPVRTQDKSKYQWHTTDYTRFLLLFLLAVIAFISVFWFSIDIVAALKAWFETEGWNQHLGGFIVETLRMGAALVFAWLVAMVAVKVGITNQQMVDETYIAPVKDFFSRYGKAAVVILLLIGVYRISDIVLGVMSNVFYFDLGFDKDQIANVVKIFGVVMTIIGGFIGGILAVRFGVIRILFLGAVLAAVTNLLFAMLAQMGDNYDMLKVVIAADNLSAGIASAAFVAYLSQLTNISFTAMQYAIFSSLMTLFPKIIGGYSGTMVDNIGYENFFILTAIMGIPVLFLVWWVAKLAPVEDPKAEAAEPAPQSS